MVEPISTAIVVAGAAVINTSVALINTLRGNRHPNPKDQLKLQEEQQARQRIFLAHQQNKQEEFQKKLAAAQSKTQIELSKMNMRFQQEQQWERFQFQAEEAKLQREFQQSQMDLRFQEQLELSRQHKETMLALREEDDKLKHYPLRLPRSQVFELYNSHYEHGESVPLLVLLSPPKINFDAYAKSDDDQFPAIEQYLTSEINKILKPFIDSRLIEVQSGIWNTKMYHGRAAVSSLFTTFRALPVLVLETIVEGHFLYFNMGFWNGSSDYPLYKELDRFNTREMLAEYAREGARKWGETARKQYIERQPEDLLKLGGVHEKNWLLLQEEEKEKTSGINWDRSWPYQYTTYHYERLASDLSAYHALIIGWLADVVHLDNQQRRPQLPSLIPQFFQDQKVDETVLFNVINTYHSMYEQLEQEIPDLIPFLYLDLAESMESFYEKDLVSDTLNRSLKAWISRRNLDLKDARSLIEITANYAAIPDWDYLRQLRKVISAFGAESEITAVEERIRLIAETIVLADDQ